MISTKQNKRHGAIFLIGLAAIAMSGCNRPSSNNPPPAAQTGATAGPTTTLPSSGSIQWIDPNTIKEGPIQHETLSGDQIDRIRKIYDAFAEVDGSSMDKWMDGFKRDLDIEKELGIWERMARAYGPFVASHNLSLAAKKEAFQVVLMRSMASEDDALAHLNLHTLSREDAIQLMRAY